MTIRVSPERTTLSLMSNRLRADDARAPTTAAKPGSSGAPSPAVGKAPASDVGQLRAATAMLDRASSVADTALAAADTITSLLERLRELAAEARDGGADNASEFRNFGQLVSQTVKAAIFDGVNLLDGSQGGPFRVNAGAEDAGELSLSAFDLTPGGPELPFTADTDVASAFEAIETALTNTRAARERLGEESKRVEAHRNFVGLLTDAVGGGGDTPLGVEGARLAALQVRQSLGGERFAIANQAPQTVLALFR